MEISFVIGGKQMRLSKEEVEGKMKGVEPGAVYIHSVTINGKRYPTKEAFAHVTGLDLLDFTTNQARRQFQKLGFEVSRGGM